MRNPRKKRNIALAMLMAGVGYIVAFTVARIGPEHNALFGGLVAAFFVSLLGITGTIAYHVTLKRYQRLLRGERLLARWTISPSEWEQFKTNERNRPSGAGRNAIKVCADRERTGIDVVVTEESLMVDHDFYHLSELRGLAWFPEPPPCLDFKMVTAGKSGSVTWHIRFPTTTGAEARARAIWDHYQLRLAPVDARRLVPRWRAVRWVCLLIAFISALALVFARMYYGDVSKQTLVLVSLIAGLLGLPLGLFIAALAQWWLRHGPGRTAGSK